MDHRFPLIPVYSANLTFQKNFLVVGHYITADTPFYYTGWSNPIEHTRFLSVLHILGKIIKLNDHPCQTRQLWCISFPKIGHADDINLYIQSCNALITLMYTALWSFPQFPYHNNFVQYCKVVLLVQFALIICPLRWTEDNARVDSHGKTSSWWHIAKSSLVFVEFLPFINIILFY